MSAKNLSNLVKFAAIALAVCGLSIVTYILPTWGKSFIEVNAEFAGWYWPWLIFLWVTFIPCFALLVFVWKIAMAIANEAVFTIKTAKWIQTGSYLLFATAGFIFAGNIVFALLKMNHIGILFLSLLCDMSVIALGALAAVHSRYITRAAVLQEESEGTL